MPWAPLARRAQMQALPVNGPIPKEAEIEPSFLLELDLRLPSNSWKVSRVL